MTTNTTTPPQNRIWLFSRPFDLLVLGLPVWITWAVCFALPNQALYAPIPLWVWVVFILGIDVGHVWSTIFRTYFDKQEFHNHRKLLVSAPLGCFVVFYALASVSTQLFWTVLAYLAVYHFIKQQYGFMRLYGAKYGKPLPRKYFSDNYVVYLAMLYPVLYWHLSSNRNFDWFIPGDFIAIGASPWFAYFHLIGNTLYWGILLCWLAEGLYLVAVHKQPVPWGKWLWVGTTAGNWYLGIVYFNSDLVFSLTNVVAHGVPYLALILYYVEQKRQLGQHADHPKLAPVALRALAMVLLVLVLAFGEEYLWDMFMYRDNEAFFSSIIQYPAHALEHPAMKALALALLSLPQTTHYVLDGYIWKSSPKNPYLKPILMK